MYRYSSESEAGWMHNIPPGLAKRLKGNVLVCGTEYLLCTILYALAGGVCCIHVGS